MPPTYHTVSSNFTFIVFTGPKYSSELLRSPDRSDSVSGLQAEQKSNHSPLHQTHSVKALGKKLAKVKRCKKYENMIAICVWCLCLVSALNVLWPSQQSRCIRYRWCSPGDARVHRYSANIPCAIAQNYSSIAKKMEEGLKGDWEIFFKQNNMTLSEIEVIWGFFQILETSALYSALGSDPAGSKKTPPRLRPSWLLWGSSKSRDLYPLPPNKAWEEWGMCEKTCGAIAASRTFKESE